ncbi:transcriptional regulator [Thalassoglobus sp. JC818]|uniref:helix-turn-helix transcriptional regulator n=1 Tax=Thalassoglobus sp. JC818 TaxID=3232136 RepID=UPI0034586A6E
MSVISKIRRLLQLLERLQSGRIHNTKELADFLKVSRRTIFRDIKTLQDSGISIHYEASQRGYWISESPYLPPTDLTLEETLSLVLLSQELGNSKRGIPFFDKAGEASLKLRSNLPNHLSSYVGELSTGVKMGTEPKSTLDDSRSHYDRALEAIADKRKLRIRYDSLYDQKEISTLISPYRIFFKRRSWYLIGRSSIHRAVRTFHLGRVRESTLTDDKFVVPKRFNLEQYFGKAWNMVRERGNRKQVTVRFAPLVARNVAEVAWHSTQTVIWNDDGTIDFHVTVDGIHEISWWILGYGDKAKVLDPPELVELIQSHIRNMSANYEQPKGD